MKPEGKGRLAAAAVFGVVLALLFAGCARPDQAVPPRAPTSMPGNGLTDALLYSGTGSWRAELDSLETILFNHGATYEEADSGRLNGMTPEDFLRFKLIIFPGGYAPAVAGALTAEAHERLRQAVQKGGLNYLGFCAGAWMAVAPAPAPGHDVIYGLGVVDGPLEKPNYLGRQGLEFAIVNALFGDGTRRDMLWYGGPVTPDVPRGVVAKYPDGTPAISQIWSGRGFVIVSGLHPTATLPILESLDIDDPKAVAPNFAWALLDGAMNQKPLRSF